MPDSAITSALRSLLPSFPASNKPFPPLLVSQCESLLALSRQRASNLKPDEEIARAHACAEIASTRLRAQLRLPGIKNGAGAPCKPKVYSNLIKFLEGSLGDVTIGSLTPRGRKRDGDGNVKNGAVSSPATGKRSSVGTPQRSEDNVENTPSKKRVVDRTPKSGFAGTVKNSRKSKKTSDGTTLEDKAPPYVMPSIRKLCKIFSTPAIVPHVYTGTCVVLELSGLWPPEEEEEESDQRQRDIQALVTALYLMVLTRMQEGQMTTEIYTQVIAKSMEALELSAEDSAAEKVEEWISKLNDEGWCSEQDWWESVPESILVFDPDARVDVDQEVAEVSDDEQALFSRKRRTIQGGQSDEVDRDGVLLPGLGTMLDNSVDWTSTERCADYEDWYADITKRLSAPTKGRAKKSKAIASN